MVSSLKNTMARKNHKERGQLDSRKRLGLLEKHKDYVHRARDYSSKQARIKKLREKAAFRNKDEFYWGMVKGKTQNGVALGDRGNVALSSETVKLLKTQDVRYVRHQISKDQRKCATIKRELESTLPPSAPGQWDARLEVAEVERLADLGIQVEAQGDAIREYKQKAKKGSKLAKGEKHLVFAEDRTEFETMGAGPSKVAEKKVKEVVEDLGWDDAPSGAVQEDSDEEDDKTTAPVLSEKDMKDAQTHRLTLYAALSAHLVRLRELRVVEAKLEKNLGHLGKGAAQRVQKAGWVEDEEAEEDRNGEKKTFRKDVWKWKLERRR